MGAGAAAIDGSRALWSDDCRAGSNGPGSTAQAKTVQRLMIVLVLPDIPEEDQLLARARGGSQAALMEIYEGYFSPVSSSFECASTTPTRRKIW